MAGSTSVDKVGKVLQDLPVDRDDVVCSFPLLAGHPHRGAAVRFRRMRLARGLLSKMASGTGLKRRWRKHAGSPEVYSLRSTPCLLPSAKRGAQPPRRKCGHLSQNGYSLSLSLSLALCFSFRLPHDLHAPAKPPSRLSLGSVASVWDPVSPCPSLWIVPYAARLVRSVLQASQHRCRPSRPRKRAGMHLMPSEAN